MARTHSSTYRQRNELAKAQGFRSYNDKRKLLSSANRNNWFRDRVNRVNGLPRKKLQTPITARTKKALELVRKHRNAVEANTQHEIGGPKYTFFVETLQMMSEDEWLELYG